MKRMKIANTARPRIRPPLPFSNEKAESSASVIWVPKTSASPNPAREQDQDIGVSQRATARDERRRPGPGRAAARRREAPSALRGRRLPWDLDRERIGRWRPMPGSRRRAERPRVISTSLRLEAARVAAPTRVTRTIGVAITTSSHHRRPYGQQHPDRRGRGRRSAPGSPCLRSRSSLRRRRRSTSARPCERSSPA